jgi:hypothetical protein
MKRTNQSLALLLAMTMLMLSGERVMAQSGYFGNWPTGTSPKEIGKRVAENFAARKFEFEQMVKTDGVEKPKRQFVIYPEICAWYGSLTVAQLTRDQDPGRRKIYLAGCSCGLSYLWRRPAGNLPANQRS